MSKPDFAWDSYVMNSPRSQPSEKETELMEYERKQCERIREESRRASFINRPKKWGFGQ